MLTKRVIPCLDVRDGRVVKGVNFVDLRDAGDPIELAAAYDRGGADEVIFLDITATSDNRVTTIDMAAHAAAELAIPYTVGGGFRDLPGMRTMVAAAPTRSRLIRLRCATPISSRKPRPHSAAKPLWWRSMPSAWASPGRPVPIGGRCTLPVDAPPLASMPLPGQRKRLAAGLVRSCSPAWTATARKPGSI